ncbi:hypothetical protein GCM10009676_42990 [Prauserella halophila]|uniref:CopG family transcriptional regulator n=1 Tax=Prauserella halophila TaxID=185641 RepID=A0ABP4H6W5_9PSEU|nr:hypothetical protein [Prauserella halophila]MCP2237830.1 Ribbon-helix-helix protein, copG family [Prauserella halophila]
MSEIDKLLTDEGAAAEQYDASGTTPDHVEVSRPNLGRPAVVSVRLSTEEHDRLQQAADDAKLPVSTLIRIWALDRLQAEREGSGGTVAERLARLEREVFQRTA